MQKDARALIQGLSSQQKIDHSWGKYLHMQGDMRVAIKGKYNERLDWKPKWVNDGWGVQILTDEDVRTWKKVRRPDKIGLRFCFVLLEQRMQTNNIQMPTIASIWEGGKGDPLRIWSSPSSDGLTTSEAPKATTHTYHSRISRPWFERPLAVGIR